MKTIRFFTVWIIALFAITVTNPAWAADTTPPMPGGYQSGYPKATGPTTIEVKWKRGSDNVTTQANLRYMVGWTKKSEDNWQNSHPEPYPKDMTAYTITGLEPNTEYLVDVEVWDEAENFQWYGQKTVKTGAGAADTEDPTPGGYTSITSTANSITLNWKRATDNVTTQANLRYVVSWKKESASIWKTSHSAPFTNWPKDMTSYTITGLDPNTEYLVDVMVVDEAGNWKYYGKKTVTTGAGAVDIQDPTPGGYEAGYPKAVGNTIEVKWKRATDNVTAPANLRYVVAWVKKSASIWKTSHPEPFTNFPKDWTSYTITGLEPNTEYYVAVGVVDEAGNGKGYDEKIVTTGAASVTIPVTGVTLSPASLNLEVGATKSLTHTVLPATATNKAVTWSSSNTALATVDGSGTVKGIAPGTATITVTTADGGKTATAAVTVKAATAPAVKVTSVTLNRNSVTINGDYEEIKLTATVAPATATDQSLTWTSDNPSVASVDATGLVTIHKKGKATITATANDGSGRSDACDFNVIMTVANETIDGLRVYAAGGALHLTLPNAATVHIYNVNGAIVKTLFLPSGDHVQPLADGMYLVRVGERVRKILIK